MKTLGAKMIGLLVAAFILCSAFRADKPVVTVFMIGDSTMANKKLDGGNPERGWGMVLPGFFQLCQPSGRIWFPNSQLIKAVAAYGRHGRPR